MNLIAHQSGGPSARFLTAVPAAGRRFLTLSTESKPANVGLDSHELDTASPRRVLPRPAHPDLPAGAVGTRSAVTDPGLVMLIAAPNAAPIRPIKNPARIA